MIKGIFPPLTTPFENDQLAFSKFAENLTFYEKYDLSGYVLFGSNGEAPFLSDSEKIEMVKFARQNTASSKVLIAGSSAESLLGSIELTNQCAGAGANYALINTPAYFKAQMNDAAFIDFFTELADAAAIPVVIYNVPKFTGVNISPKAISELSKHANIAGIKESSTNLAQVSEIINLADHNFSTITGSASVLMPSLLMGASGGVLALANILPQTCIDIYSAIKNGTIDDARKMQLDVLETNKAITARFGIPGLKYVMDQVGLFGGPVRKPLLPLGSDGKVVLDGILDFLKSIKYL